jgi:hypothetical protein
MIPATMRTTLMTTSPLTAPPKITIDNRNPQIGVNARSYPAPTADIIDRTLLKRK